MSHQEYVVTGYLKDSKGKERQTYLLHRSIFTDSKERAIADFQNYFSPDLELIKIYSVIDNNGNKI